MPLASPTMLPARWFEWRVFLSLLAVLGASGFVFIALVRRWTTRRHWLELSRWAEANRMKLLGATKATVPPPLASVTEPPPTASLALVSNDVSFVEMHTLKQQRTDTSQFTRWHVALRRMETGDWPPTGLRPRANASSIVDLFPAMTSYPSMLPPERFVLFGTDSAAARRLAKSTLPALLPPDVALLLHGSTLILEFTARPMDPMELSRMSGLIEQLLGRVPAIR